MAHSGVLDMDMFLYCECVCACSCLEYKALLPVVAGEIRCHSGCTCCAVLSPPFSNPRNKCCLECIYFLLYGFQECAVSCTFFYSNMIKSVVHSLAVVVESSVA